MAFVLVETDDSTQPTDDDFVEGDFLLLLDCFDRLNDTAGSPMVASFCAKPTTE